MAIDNSSKDIIGTAILDFHLGNYSEDIITYSSISGQDIIPLPYLFRKYDEMPMIEQKALQLVKGDILDIGCGAGSHALYLQENNNKIKAIDISRGAIEVCKLRGIETASVQNIYDLKDEKFDTILALMNGVGICEKLENLEHFLNHLKSLLEKNGQILMDSSDLVYMFEDEGYYLDKNENYYGEVRFNTSYKGIKGDYFDWLYVDFITLQNHARKVGLNCQLVLEGDNYDYLARLTISP